MMDMKIKYYIKPNGNTNIANFIEYAEKNKCGIELSTFSKGNILDAPNLTEIVKNYKEQLSHIPKLILHGVYADMYPVSPDDKTVKLCMERMLKNIEIARELDAKGVVFHTNYNPLIGEQYTTIYGTSWEQKQAEYWKKLAPIARNYGITIYLENSWDTKPELIKGILELVNSDNMKACFDVGHANVYSPMHICDWMSALECCTDYIHVSDNRGIHYMDEHLPIGDGLIDWNQFFSKINHSNNKLGICIEVYKDNLIPTEKSIKYLSNIMKKS